MHVFYTHLTRLLHSSSHLLHASCTSLTRMLFKVRAKRRKLGIGTVYPYFGEKERFTLGSGDLDVVALRDSGFMFSLYSSNSVKKLMISRAQTKKLVMKLRLIRENQTPPPSVVCGNNFTLHIRKLFSSRFNRIGTSES